MKKTVATICLLGATLGLSACSGTTQGEDPYYATGRTAAYGDEMAESTPSRVAPAEKVFQRAQAK